MDCTTCKEHLLAYHYDELEPATREEVERALASCPECAAALAEMRDVANAYAALPVPEPSARLRQNVLREARLAVAAPPQPSWWAAWVSFAVPVALVIGGAWLAVEIATGGEPALPSASRELAEVAPAPVSVAQQDRGSADDGTVDEQAARALVNDAPEEPTAARPSGDEAQPAPSPSLAAPSLAPAEPSPEPAEQEAEAAPPARGPLDLGSVSGGAARTGGGGSAGAIGGTMVGSRGAGASPEPPASPPAPAPAPRVATATGSTGEQQDERRGQAPVDDLAVAETARQRAAVVEELAEAELSDSEAVTRRERRRASPASAPAVATAPAAAEGAAAPAFGAAERNDSDAPTEQNAAAALRDGLAALDAGALDRARRLFERVSEHPDATAAERGSALYHRGVLAHRQGDNERAGELLLAYTRAYPSGTHRTEADALLRRLDAEQDAPASNEASPR
jgi:TolA-binding protein